MKYYFRLLPVLFFFLISCSTGRLSKEKERAILQSEHGYIEITFNDDIISDEFLVNAFGVKMTPIWECKLFVNKEEYLWLFFKANFKYKFPISAGENIITYRLYTENYAANAYCFTTDDSCWLPSEYSQLKVFVPREKVVQLNIFKKG